MIIAGLEFNPAGSAADPGSTEYLEANKAFKDVYFTGLIRDKQGRKMSKSLGNSPDPLDLIAKYGADGIRFGLMRIAPQGQDIRFDEKQVEEGRNFCNKLWNACRFRTMQGEVDPGADPGKHELSPFSQDILQRLDSVIARVDEGFKNYEFSAVASSLYEFVWDDFCARFLETAKADFLNPESPTRAGTLATFDYVISKVLRMLHPYTPFLTEELWLELGFSKESIQFQAWPRVSNLKLETSNLKLAESIYSAMDASRQLRGEFQIALNKKVVFKLKNNQALGTQELGILKSLINAESLDLITEAPAKTPMAITPLGDLYLPLEGLIDVAQEKIRLEKEILKAQTDLEREEKKLSNEKMLAHAPAEKVEEWRSLAQAAKENLAKLQAQLDQL
jgi:valyl-tRNA synthetase